MDVPERNRERNRRLKGAITLLSVTATGIASVQLCCVNARTVGTFVFNFTVPMFPLLTENVRHMWKELPRSTVTL